MQDVFSSLRPRGMGSGGGRAAAQRRMRTAATVAHEHQRCCGRRRGPAGERFHQDSSRTTRATPVHTARLERCGAQAPRAEPNQAGRQAGSPRRRSRPRLTVGCRPRNGRAGWRRAADRRRPIWPGREHRAEYRRALGLGSGGGRRRGLGGSCGRHNETPVREAVGLLMRLLGAMGSVMYASDFWGHTPDGLEPGVWSRQLW